MGKLTKKKFMRELRRIGRQFRNIRTSTQQMAYDHFLATRHYDRKVAPTSMIREGSRPFSERVAIVVLYPVNGVLPSHIRMLDYLASKGFASVVLSNAEIAEEGVSQICEKCWRFISRPNVGYDFGAYRDGVRFVRDSLPKIEQLVFINDSTWFPMADTADWLEQVAALDVDFAAAASNYGVPRPNAEDFQEQSWGFSVKHRNFHYCSFALSIRPVILRDRGFMKFWDSYKLSDDKQRTVRRGEIGLSQWVIRRGYSHDSTLPVFDLDNRLRALPEDRLRAVAQNMVIPAHEVLVKIKQEIAFDPGTDRETLVRFILTTVALQGSSYALSDFSVRDLGYPFLKKSPLWLDEDASEISMRILKDHGGALTDALVSEASALRNDRADWLNKDPDEQSDTLVADAV
ncbi:MAG: rhamnan synthesis F family protein [Pseudomonadota bacterium]